MPLGVTLADLRKQLRAETGQSLNPAQGVQAQETQNMVLHRQQRELWDAYAWPHLRFSADVALSSGQSVYNYPTDMPFDQIGRAAVAISSNVRNPTTLVVTTTWSDWKPLAYGIRLIDIPPGGAPLGTPKQWSNKVTVDGGITNPTGQMLLFPTPSFDNNQTDNAWQEEKVRLFGQAPCTDLRTDGDRCVIDSDAIVLFAAAEVLAVAKSEAASLKLTKAQNYLRRLLQNSGADKRANFNMGGSRINHLGSRPYGARAGLDYIAS